MAARCDFIKDLPEGVCTIVGNRGVKFSGGQRQRIAIARAFLKNAPLLLLDEATSALDSESEEAIREALGRLMQGRTVIAIAHRLSSLRNFDRIVVLQLGSVIQDGPPDLLAGREGVYRQLVQREVDRLARQAAAQASIVKGDSPLGSDVPRREVDPRIVNAVPGRAMCTTGLDLEPMVDPTGAVG
jgi:ATP-binding cassette subfamily B protein